MKRRRAKESADEESSWSAKPFLVKNQQMRREVKEMKRRRAKESADEESSWSAKHARKGKVAKLGNQTQATAHIVESFYEPVVTIHPVARYSAEAQSSSRHGSAAKQLTIYESWMSTAELNSNGKNDKKPAKEKDTKALYAKATPLKKVDEKTVSSGEVVRPESCCRTEKKINRRQQQRENESELKLSTIILERA
ncbi:hypothetical protein F511_33126 [Dorcoceras hygrometricum]|uniref:Uncharacterized protein n=1 Tax=Dorcoceras hygrometricum TaxID=472368 RepID=A0A2Z7CUR0_9LAMI|nr:hypothetical protein F511_33126 [Dorcoceras hygrometricum]